ncbi:hypothetical protein ABIB87_008722 [Bradyrhizobium sp. JR18.2]
MAGNTIDKLKDGKASPDDQVSRKRRLVKARGIPKHPTRPAKSKMN